MTILQNIINNKLNKIIQAEKIRNRAALKCLVELGFPIDRVRKSLFDLNGLRIQGMGNGEVSDPTLYNALRGLRENGPAATRAKELICAPLRLEVKELWPN